MLYSVWQDKHFEARIIKIGHEVRTLPWFEHIKIAVMDAAIFVDLVTSLSLIFCIQNLNISSNFNNILAYICIGVKFP